MTDAPTTPIAKVTAFVTRGEGISREILVFRHPTAGVQFPAGTAEPEEAPSAAVLREVTEETGLTEFAVISCLGVRVDPLPDSGRLTVRETRLRSAPGAASSAQDFSVRRGWTVHEIEKSEGYSHVEFREYVLQDGVMIIDKVTTGWVPIQDLSAAVERHFSM